MGEEGIPTFIAVLAAAAMVIGVMVAMVMVAVVLLIGAQAP